jgi:hypothetical protein
MAGGILVVLQVVIIPVSRRIRMRMIRLDGGNAAQHQACGKQEGLKQCSGFHENVSFVVCLMKQ